MSLMTCRQSREFSVILSINYFKLFYKYIINTVVVFEYVFTKYYVILRNITLFYVKLRNITKKR